jgi:Gpi18-like mannosyltransferase
MKVRGFNSKYKRFIKSADFKDISKITIIFLISSIIFYGYYFLFSSFKFQLLYQSWDGPAYVVVARSFYNLSAISQANTVGLPAYYFANYFPLYPLFIWLFSFIGYWRSSLFVSQLFTLFFLVTMYFLFKTVYPNKKLNWVVFPFLLFPARWFSITHIGSSEPLFLFFVALFTIFLVKEKYLYSAIFLILAQLTRHAAIWLFMGVIVFFIFSVFTKKISISQAIKKMLPFFLVPIIFLLINVFFYLRYRDLSFIMAYTQKSSYFRWPPFGIFNIQGAGDVWKESVIFNYLIYLGSVLLLFREKKYNLGFLALLNFIPLVFLVQEDLSRIALAGLPFLYLGYHKIVTNKVFQISLILLSPAIYAFSIAFLNYNISP